MVLMCCTQTYGLLLRPNGWSPDWVSSAYDIGMVGKEFFVCLISTMIQSSGVVNGTIFLVLFMFLLKDFHFSCWWIMIVSTSTH